MWEEGITIAAPAELSWSAALDAAVRDAQARGDRLARPAPRLIVSGQYLARPSVAKQAVRDFAFATGPTPLIVVHGEDGAQLVRQSVDALRAGYKAVVIGLSISYAMPPPMPDVPDDDTRRSGGGFEADFGYLLQRPQAPRVLRVHAEFGPLRSNEVMIRLTP